LGADDAGDSVSAQVPGTCRRPTIAYAVDTFLPPTYTWIRNFCRNIHSYEIIFFAAFREGTVNAVSASEVYVLPGLVRGDRVPLAVSVVRRLLRWAIYSSGISETVFAFIARRREVRLIHAHFALVAWRYRRAARSLAAPLIVSFYGYDYDFILRRLPKWRRRYRKIFEDARLILTEGEFGRASVIAKGCPPDRVRVHHLGVEVDTIPFAPRQLRAGETLRLIQVASFAEKKGHAVTVEALRRLRDVKSLDRVKLTFIGNGPTRPQIQSLVRRHALDSYVDFLDYLPYDRLHRELLEHHVFIHPSVTAADGDCEGGAPVVLLDAQATGMPVLSSLHCDIPEEVLHGKTGLLVPERDAQALADAIQTLLDQPELVATFSRAARVHIAENYCARTQAEALERIYREVLTS
jgi:colanic acid/amylovoran biosynthesis glycosyltransferase